MRILRMYATRERAVNAFQHDAMHSHWSAKVNFAAMTITLENGTVFHYEHSVDRIHGMEYSGAWFDEAADVSTRSYALTRVRP